MNITILDSHLREHLKTNAQPNDIAHALSLTSASIERVEPYGKNDYLYTIEITTNRPDMVSVRGIAREAASVLPTFDYKASLIDMPLPTPHIETKEPAQITIVNDATLVRRICGVVLEVTKGESPPYIKERLEAAGIRSLNNLIDVTNYIMLEMGHPCHAFDYDRLLTKKLIIRQSRKGETLITLDKKRHTLHGGDIVADNGKGEIIDLLGVMGTANSVVTETTKRVLFFFDNNDPWRIRKTSMGLAIRTEAAALNEKGVDPTLTMPALKRGVALYKKIADAKVISDVIDMYPGKGKPKTIAIQKEKISNLIGVPVSAKKAIDILSSLGFTVRDAADFLTVTPPSWREHDIVLAEDVIEEIARIYGYHNLPSSIPSFSPATPFHMDTNPFYWEKKAKDAFKYWGFTEVYTYSLIATDMLTEPVENVLTLRNPLDEEHVHMRTSLIPSLETVIQENKDRETVCIFELANIYHKQKKGLPKEVLTLGFLMKGNRNGEPVTYYHAKGIIEQLAKEFCITDVRFNKRADARQDAAIMLHGEQKGTIYISAHPTFGIAAELDFDAFRIHASTRKKYIPLPKFPPVLEDITFMLDTGIKTGDVIWLIKKQSSRIGEVILKDTYENARTFHIVYQDQNKNLTNEEVAKIREKIIKAAEETYGARVK